MSRDFFYWTDDNFEVIFDTHLDKRNGYVFVINPNGARSDVLTTEDGKGFNLDWNGVWDAATTINEKGWFGEMKIPFSTLKFQNKTVQDWGVNFERNIRRKQEQLFWQGWSRNYDFEHVSHAGTMVGLTNITGKEDIEFKPYITSGFSQDTAFDYVIKAGGDANYMLTNTLKLNLTANTDFAQVESDRIRINLSRFSLYYPEKRDFFLEGKEDFFLNLNGSNKIFYSRQIGISNGTEVPIYGGARLIGKAGRTNIGLLSIQTQPKNDVPSTNYTVVRLSQDVLEKSNAGMILTAKNSSEGFNFVYGMDLKYKTSGLFGDKNLAVKGLIAQSQTRDSVVGDNLAYGLQLVYPNDLVYFEMAGIGVQKKFNPEIGFLDRKNYKLGYTKFMLQPRPGFLPFIQQLKFRLLDAAVFLTDNSNRLESVGLGWTPLGIVTKSGEYIGFHIQTNYDRLDESFNILGSNSIPEGEYWFTKYIAEISSFQGRDLSIGFSSDYGDFYNGKSFSIASSANWSISRHLMVSGDYSRSSFELPGGNFAADEYGGSIKYAFNPKINSILFSQWNNQTEEILLNFRFHWIPVVGSDFYIVINQTYNTRSGKIHLSNTTVLSKLVWRLGF